MLFTKEQKKMYKNKNIKTNEKSIRVSYIFKKITMCIRKYIKI